ncbi:MAG: hypothetical protein NC925_03945, partial [Candidatus Omnitrophica bacterium]|nr:hypothetical protein [Candidatus Omnitrophota bacterium]
QQVLGENLPEDLEFRKKWLTATYAIAMNSNHQSLKEVIYIYQQVLGENLPEDLEFRKKWLRSTYQKVLMDNMQKQINGFFGNLSKQDIKDIEAEIINGNYIEANDLSELVSTIEGMPTKFFILTTQPQRAPPKFIYERIKDGVLEIYFSNEVYKLFNVLFTDGEKQITLKAIALHGKVEVQTGSHKEAKYAHQAFLSEYPEIAKKLEDLALLARQDALPQKIIHEILAVFYSELTHSEIENLSQLVTKEDFNRNVPPYIGDKRASPSVASSPLSLLRELPSYRGWLGVSVAAPSLNYSKVLSYIAFFTLITFVFAIFTFAGKGILSLLKILGILSSITVLEYVFLTAAILHIVLASIAYFGRTENNIALKIQSALGVVIWLTLWTILTYFISPLGWFNMPIIGHLLTAVIGFGNIAVITTTLTIIFGEAYTKISIWRMNRKELYEKILALDREGKIKEEDLKDLNLKDLRKLYVHLLSIAKKSFKEKVRININAEGWFKEILNELADSRIGLASEFAVSLDETMQLVLNIISKIGRYLKVKSFAIIFAIPISLIIAPIYFILRITVLFFSKFSLRNVRFLQSYNKGEIKLDNLSNNIRAFKIQIKKQNVFDKIRYIWNSLVLKAPIFGGILEFVWSRVTLAIFSGIIAHPLAALIGLEGVIKPLLWIYSLLPSSIESFFIQHLLPTYTNLLSILILSFLLSLKPSLQNIRNVYLDIFVAPKFGLSTFNIETLIKEKSVDKNLEELYRQGYLYYIIDPYLGNLIDERGISAVGYLKIAFSYLAFTPLYILNAFIPFGLVFKFFGFGKRYLAFANVLNMLRWGFWSSTLGLATIGLEIGAAQALATYTGGPLETLIGPWEGSSTYPYPILGVGNYIIGAVENYLDLDRQFESEVLASISRKVKEVNEKEFRSIELYYLEKEFKNIITELKEQGLTSKDIERLIFLTHTPAQFKEIFYTNDTLDVEKVKDFLANIDKVINNPTVKNLRKENRITEEKLKDLVASFIIKSFDEPLEVVIEKIERVLKIRANIRTMTDKDIRKVYEDITGKALERTLTMLEEVLSNSDLARNGWIEDILRELDNLMFGSISERRKFELFRYAVLKFFEEFAEDEELYKNYSNLFSKDGIDWKLVIAILEKTDKGKKNLYEV